MSAIERTHMACHEAGHAIVAEYLGQVIFGIKVSSKQGHCSYGGPRDIDTIELRIDHIAIYYAGHLAQVELRMGRGNIRRSIQRANSDCAGIARLLEGQKDWRHQLREGRRLALQIIRFCRADIADLTQVLDRRGILDQRGYADFRRYGKTLFLGISWERAALVTQRLLDHARSPTRLYHEPELVGMLTDDL